MPTNTPLQTTEDSQPPNDTLMTNHQKKTPTRNKDVSIQLLTATLQLIKKDRMLYVSLQFRQYENHGLLDTGAIQSARSEHELRGILSAHPAALLEEHPAPDFKVQIAIEETFMILPTMGNILIGMSFFRKYTVTLDLANKVVKFSDITLQLKPERGRYKIQMIKLRTTQKTVIQPDHQLIVPVLAERDLGTIQGTLETFPAFERKTQLLVSPSLAQIPDMKSHVQITNLTSHTITHNPIMTVATYRIMTPNQAKNLQPMSNVLNQLFQEPGTNTDRRWYPTPETCDDPSKLNCIETRIYDEITKLHEEEKLDPTADDQQRKAFQWENSILTEQEQQYIENLLVKYKSVFSRHLLDIGIKTDFKIKLTPKHDEPVYTQSLPTPTNLKVDLLVELALMHEYGIITTLPYSKYSSPIFDQRKPNGKLRNLVDLRGISHLLKNDYNQQNHPVTTLADAAQHMAGKKYFCKLDCSQAYHHVQMADEQ